MLSQQLASEAESLGDLFGALIGRKLYTDSDIYVTGNIRLSIPSLHDPRDIIPDSTSKRAFLPLPTDKADRDCSAQEACPQHPPDERLPSPVDGETSVESVGEDEYVGTTLLKSFNRYTSRYLSESSLESYTKVVYPRTPMMKLLVQEEVVRACIHALQGTNSDIFEAVHSQVQIKVFGYTSGAAMSAVCRYGPYMYISQLVQRAAHSILSSSLDPAQLALATGVNNIIHLINSYLGSMLTEDFTTESPGGPLTLLHMWQRTTFHRCMLVILFNLVIESSIRDKSGLNSPDISELQVDYRYIKSFLMTAHSTTTQSATVLWSDLPAGWDLFGRVLAEKEVADQADGGLSINIAERNKCSMCIHVLMSYLVRSVSVPLFRQFEQRLFNPDYYEEDYDQDCDPVHPNTSTLKALEPSAYYMLFESTGSKRGSNLLQKAFRWVRCQNKAIDAIRYTCYEKTASAMKPRNSYLFCQAYNIMSPLLQLDGDVDHMHIRKVAGEIKDRNSKLLRYILTLLKKWKAHFFRGITGYSSFSSDNDESIATVENDDLNKDFTDIPSIDTVVDSIPDGVEPDKPLPEPTREIEVVNPAPKPPAPEVDSNTVSRDDFVSSEVLERFESLITEVQKRKKWSSWRLRKANTTYDNSIAIRNLYLTEYRHWTEELKAKDITVDDLPQPGQLPTIPARFFSSQASTFSLDIPAAGANAITSAVLAAGGGPAVDLGGASEELTASPTSRQGRMDLDRRESFGIHIGDAASSVQVSQAPGGDSTIDLRHASDPVASPASRQGRMDLDRGESFGIHTGDTATSVQVSQAPGGDSTMDLGHSSDPVASPASRQGRMDLDRGESFGIHAGDTASSVQVSQAPGGDSTMDLRHASDPVASPASRQGRMDLDRGESFGIHTGDTASSVQVSQAPGGDSTMDLGHSSEPVALPTTESASSPASRQGRMDLDRGESVEFFADIMLSADDRLSSVDRRPMQLPDGTADAVSVSVPCDDSVSVRNVPEILGPSGDENAAGYFAEDQAVYEILKSLETVCAESCLRNGADGDLSKLLSLEAGMIPSAGSMSLIVKEQCLSIDYYLYFMSLTRGRALDHINCFEDHFIFSARSDFLVNFSNVLFDSFISKRSVMGPSCAAGNNFYSRRGAVPLELWSALSFSGAFERLVNRAGSFQLGDRLTFSVLPSAAISGDHAVVSLRAASVSSRFSVDKNPDANTVLNNVGISNVLIPAVLGELFSVRGLLGNLHLKYEVPWPMNCLFGGTAMRSTHCLTERLLELGHMSCVKRYVWEHLRAAGRKHRHFYNSKIERQLYQAYRRIHQFTGVIFDFSVDRIRLHQMELRNEVVSSAHYGFKGLVDLFGKHLVEMQRATYCVNNYEAPALTNPGVSNRIAELLHSARHLLLLLLTACSDNASLRESDKSIYDDSVMHVAILKSIQENMENFNISISELQNEVKTTMLSGDTESSSNVLIMFLSAL